MHCSSDVGYKLKGKYTTINKASCSLQVEVWKVESSSIHFSLTILHAQAFIYSITDDDSNMILKAILA